MPKKTKKGGGGKVGGRTEGERLLFLQQRAQAEEETAKKKEEILTLFLKDKLQKEERNTAVNLLKLNDGWRSILRQTRAAELRKDVTVLTQTFERQLDALDSVIKNLEHDLQEAERQSAQVQRVHLQQVERLWAQQDKRLTFVQQQWESGLQQLSSRFNSDRKQMLDHSEQQRADLEAAVFNVEEQHRNVVREIHRLYRAGMESYDSSIDLRKATLVMANSPKLKEEALKLQEAEQLCSKEKRDLHTLLQENQQLVQTTQTDMKKVKLLQDSVVTLRRRLTSSKTEHQSVEQHLTAARDQVNRSTHKLRDQLIQAQTATRKQLIDLTVQSDNAAKRLQAVIAKGETVIRAAEMSRKLESEVLPTLPAEGHRQEAAPETQETAQPVPELHQVTRSINAAMLQREALKRHREDLIRENQQLRLLLRQHLDAMTVSHQHLDQRHALLTVYRAPTTTDPPNTSRRHTVIEAVHAVKHSL
uniref:dynein regulatory complex subunit 2 n=1 Tax=Semicossyphus pulcher TaxID=241346 RepID=UPI0037E9419F